MKRLIGLLLVAACLPAQAERSAEEVVACMQRNVLPASQVQEVELEATDIEGEKRLMTGKLFSTREDLPDAPQLLRANLRINSPEHLAGAAFLLKQTEDRRFDSMYVYLPAVKRVRRVNTEFADGPLMGTNFSYFEFKQLSNAFGDLSGELLGTEKYEGRKVHVMSFKATAAGPQTAYTSVKVRVDQKSCVILNAEFMKGSALRKRLTAPPDAVRKTGDYYYPAEMEMRDVLDNTHTVLRIVKAETVKDLPARYFAPNTFYLGN